MNPEDAIAIQAMKQRLQGTPMPASSQLSGQAPVQAQQPSAPLLSPFPVPDRRLGTQDAKRTPSEAETLAKNLIPGTGHHDPRVQGLSKALLNHLIPYLGPQAAPAAPVAPR